MRASKTVNGEKTTYQYVSGKLMYEECNGAEKYYFYDSNGVISGIRYFDANDTMTMIYVVTNALGDVIALYDKNGNAVVEYQYDAWGNIISETNATGGTPTSLAQYWSEINPFRYRSYYYDAETGLYYLNSRYYDSETGRFINADDASVINATPDALTDKNLFAYCDNNPVTRADLGGNFWHILVGAAVGVATQYVSDVVTSLVEGKSFKEALVPTSTWADYSSAAISGGLAASGIGLGLSITANAALGGATYLTNCAINGEDANLLDFGISTGVGAFSGIVGGSGVDGANLRGIVKTSKRVLETAVSPRKIAMYTTKISTVRNIVTVGTIRTVLSGFTSNGLNYCRKLFTKSSS